MSGATRVARDMLYPSPYTWFHAAMIYFDNQATTPIDPRVLDAMMPYMTSEFGNAASRTHDLGRRAADAVEKARAQVAALIGASGREIVFTSGATESINLAIKGVVEAYRTKGDHVITTVIEHKATLDTCLHLERIREEEQRWQQTARASRGAPAGDGLASPIADGSNPSWTLESSSTECFGGARVTYVRTGREGIVAPEDVASAISSRTILVCVMLANNEIGTIQPVRRIAEVAKDHGVIVHADLAQGVGKVPVNVDELAIDLGSLSAHKMYGPKGVGALYVRSKPKVRVRPLFDGGGHEGGLRSGTLNVPAVVGFGAACELAAAEMQAEAERLLSLRELLRQLLTNQLSDLNINGSMVHRLPGNLNVSFGGVEAEAIMIGLRGVALSSGSACTSASMEPSYVLKACGVEDEAAFGSIRFAIGRFNTEAEVREVAELVVDRVSRLRRIRMA